MKVLLDSKCIQIILTKSSANKNPFPHPLGFSSHTARITLKIAKNEREKIEKRLKRVK